MCKVIKYERDLIPENISVYFERDNSLRATEVLVINNGVKGEYGIKLMCHDNGKIDNGHALEDGVDLIEW